MTDAISATFETRRSAELAIEHLVQEHGIDRKDISVDAEGSANSSGTVRSGADAAPASGSNAEPKLEGAIHIRVRRDASKHGVVESALKEAGASFSKTAV